MTQLEQARQGNITREMEIVSRQESLPVEKIVELIATGRAVIPANPLHKNLEPRGVGKYLRTKTNANIGTSGDFQSLEAEVEKLEWAVRHGADAVMDLSTGGDLNVIRRELLLRSTVPFGNVPLYQMAVQGASADGFVNMNHDEMFDILEIQAADGVDFMTLHAGLTRRAVDKLHKKPRLAGIVSRGGSLITAWMLHNDRENPFFESFDRLLDLAKRHDVTLSLGDGLRPGSLSDGSDWGQIEELMTLGELVKRSRDAGVQVMVEGPGHLPLPQIEMNIRMQKEICDEAPFYVLGPLVTDIAPGYDHITSAIGGAIAGAAGADFLCYVTPAEHLGLPDAADVKEGIMAARIAAHAADIAKGIPGAGEWDRRMAEARGKLDWEAQERLSIDPERFREVRRRRPSSRESCSMCGDLCVYKVLKDYQL